MHHDATEIMMQRNSWTQETYLYKTKLNLSHEQKTNFRHDRSVSTVLLVWRWSLYRWLKFLEAGSRKLYDFLKMLHQRTFLDKMICNPGYSSIFNCMCFIYYFHFQLYVISSEVTGETCRNLNCCITKHNCLLGFRFFLFLCYSK